MEYSKTYQNKIRQLRNANHMTQEELAEKVDVNVQSVKAWEKGGDIKLKNLLMLCDVFKCDLDCLVGRISESTHDIHFIHEFTGLSEDAIEKIRRTENNKLDGIVLSWIIESEMFAKLLTTYFCFRMYLFGMDKTAFTDSTVAPFMNLSREKVILSPRQALNHFKQEVSAAINSLCERDIEIKQISEWNKRK